MDSEKDRFGDKLRDAEKAREDKFFADRDRELLEKLRRESALGDCPSCGVALAPREDGPLRAAVCPAGHGAWLPAESAPVLGGPEAAAALGRLLAPR